MTKEQYERLKVALEDCDLGDLEDENEFTELCIKLSALQTICYIRMHAVMGRCIDREKIEEKLWADLQGTSEN